MKIGILTGWYPNKIVAEDGLSVRNQAVAMHQAGWDVSVLSINMMRQYLNLGIGSRTLSKSTHHGLKEYRLEGFHPSIRTYWLLKNYNRLARKLAQYYLDQEGRPDLLHVHNYPAGLLALWIKEKHGIPYVLTEHSTHFMTGKVPKSHRLLLDQILANSSGNYAVSSALASAMQDHTGHEIGTLGNYIDTDLFAPARHRPAEASPTLVTVSTLIPRKQVHLLIAAMPLIRKQHAGCQLHIVGYGPSEAELKAQAAELGMTDAITFLGPRDQKGVAAALQAGDLFVNASHTETFGVVYAEAMACGLPVVALDSGGIRDIVSDGLDGYVVREAKDLASAIIKALDRESQWDRAAIRNRCLSRYGIPALLDSHLALYQSILT